MAEIVKKERSSNFEILRIISMIFIIAHHFACHAIYPSEIPLYNSILLSSFFVLGKIGVNLFVLISGYFLYSSNIKINKVIKLILQIDFFSILFYLIFAGIDGSITGMGIVENLFAVFFEKYWFMTAYIVMYLSAPFLNILINKTNKLTHFLTTLFMIGLFLGLSYISGINFIVNIGWFFAVYLLGAFIRKYGDEYIKSIKWYYFLIIFLVLYVLIVAVDYCFLINLYSLTNPVGLIWALSLFLALKNIKIKNIKWVNIIASFTLGIYLIHDNNFVRPWIWNELFRCGKYSQFGYFIVFAIAVVLGVFVGCSIIEFLRQKLFNGIEKFGTIIYKKIKK